MYYDMPYVKLGPENKDVILITTCQPLNFILAKLLQELMWQGSKCFILSDKQNSFWKNPQQVLVFWMSRGPPMPWGQWGHHLHHWRIHEQQLHLQHTSNASSEKAGCTACNEGPKCYFSYNVLLIGSQCCQNSNRDTYRTRVGESTKSIRCYHFWSWL